MRERTRGNGGFLTLVQIKELDIVDYLLELGFEPDKVRNVDHWYLSQFRNERTASFKVNRNLNRWYDHGLGSGGNLVDFAILFYQCTVREVVNLFSDYLSFHKPRPRPVPRVMHLTKSPLEILSTGNLSIESLIRYIASRSVFEGIAKRYCRQVDNRVGDRRTVSVFERMFDFFLFVKTIMSQTVEVPENHEILNSISLFERSRSFLERHSHINLYLGRDTAGLKCSLAAKAISEKYNDASGLYDGFKDLNDWYVSVT